MLSKDIPQNIHQYQIEFLIGQGSSSCVYQAKNTKTGQRVAMKFVNRSIFKDRYNLENMERELRILERLNHPHIAKLIETIYLPNYIVIVQELLISGTLASFVNTSNYNLEEKIYLNWAKELCEALQYLHSKGIAHRDIKPANIGVDEEMHIKLLDFNLCLENSRIAEQACGTPLFAAPDIYMYDHYDAQAADMWALGVTMHFIITGSFPFKNLNYDSFVDDITNPNFIHNQCKGRIGHVIDMVLKFNPKERCSAEQLLNSGLFPDDKPPKRLASKSVYLKRPERFSFSPKVPPRRSLVIIQPTIRSARQLVRI